MKKKMIPEEFSLDRLLEDKEQEILQMKQISSFGSDNTSDNDLPNSFNCAIERDGSVFSLKEAYYPARVFEFISNRNNYKLHCIPSIENYQWIIVSNFPEITKPSQTILFSLCQEMILANSEEIGRVIYQFSRTFPNNSLNYQVWFDFLIESIVSSPNLSDYILSLASISIFFFNDDIDMKQVYYDLFLLFFSSLLCGNNRSGIPHSIVVVQFYEFLSNTEFDDQDILFLVDKCKQLVNDLPISSISNFVSNFPMVKDGYRFLYTLSFELLQQLIGDSLDGFSALPLSLIKIRTLCNSYFHEDLVKASAALIIVEKIIHSSLKLDQIDVTVINGVSEALKFQISNSNKEPGTLLSLKEQIHITRTQCEIIERLIENNH